MSEKAYVGVSISDIHFGAGNASNLYDELKSSFLNYIDEMPVLDYVTITGDYFDGKISMDSQTAKYSIHFMRELLERSREKKFKVRVIQGTRSHDNDQLRILEMIMAEEGNYDFKVIYNLSEEMLFDDMRVLYIPEEYVASPEEYYGGVLDGNNRFDMIFMHGMVTDVAFMAGELESEIVSNKAPIFDSSHLLSHCTGFTISGHIHTAMVIKERFYYTGSFSRWSHGEEGDKGFNVIMYSPITGKGNVEFQRNEFAQEYTTIRIVDKEFFIGNIEDILKKFKDTLNILDAKFVRFKISIPEEYENPNLLINAVKEIFSSNKRVKTLFEVTSKTNKEKIIKEKIDILMERYKFLFDRKISHSEKISLFIKEKYSTDISEEEIRGFIYDAIK